MTDDAPIRELAATVVSELAAAGLTIATAESCTGGWIAKAITDIPGSSDVLGHGIVSYSNAAKSSLLAVPTDTLFRHGAVSEEVVQAMAEGVVALSGADLGVAVSGIAGPGGGSDEKPVGTVWFAWARRTGDDIAVSAGVEQFDGDRDEVRRQSLIHALEGARKQIEA